MFSSITCFRTIKRLGANVKREESARTCAEARVKFALCTPPRALAGNRAAPRRGQGQERFVPTVQVKVRPRGGSQYQPITMFNLSQSLSLSLSLSLALHLPFSLSEIGRQICREIGAHNSRPFLRRSICQSLRRSVCQSLRRSVYQSLRRSVCQSLGRSVCQSLRRSVCQSLRRSVYQSLRRSVCQSLGRSVCQSILFLNAELSPPGCRQRAGQSATLFGQWRRSGRCHRRTTR